MMSEASFIAATRHSRAVIVMAACDRIDCRALIKTGDMIELVAMLRGTGRTSLLVKVELWEEHLLSGTRHQAAAASFTTVAVDYRGRPTALRIS